MCLARQRVLALVTILARAKKDARHLPRRALCKARPCQPRLHLPRAAHAEAHVLSVPPEPGPHGWLPPNGARTLPGHEQQAGEHATPAWKPDVRALPESRA